jgi:hypothetical protein
VPKLQGLKHRDILDPEVEIIQVELVLRDSKIQVIVDREKEEEIPLRVQAETADFDSIGEALQVAMLRESCCIDLQFCTDLPLEPVFRCRGPRNTRL